MSTDTAPIRDAIRNIKGGAVAAAAMLFLNGEDPADKDAVGFLLMPASFDKDILPIVDAMTIEAGYADALVGFGDPAEPAYGADLGVDLAEIGGAFGVHVLCLVLSMNNGMVVAGRNYDGLEMQIIEKAVQVLRTTVARIVEQHPTAGRPTAH